jgi:hypothetical protein
MRKSFPAFQLRTEDEFGRLWSTCVFAFDASALLDLYRVTPESRNEFLGILEQLKDRLWLPHQAGLEYYTNRSNVIADGEASYEQIPRLAQEAVDRFRKSLDAYRQYRWVEDDRWLGILEAAVEKIATDLKRERHVLKDYTARDPIEHHLNELFAGRVGDPYPDMHQMYIKAEQRLQLSVPPGFKDVGNKKDFRRYGDVILWFQLLDFAKSQDKPLVLITSDSKADWWLTESGKTLGPRPESWSISPIRR